MAVGRHFENGFIAITLPGIIRFQRNLVCNRKLRFQGGSHDKVPHIYSKYKCKKTVVYLQLITAKWHIENSKNNGWWYYFRSTL